jgi:uncharacterized membrane protein
MQSALQDFAKWLQDSGLATSVRTSAIYPYIQTLHFTGLSLWLGTNLIVDLRILGIGDRKRTAADVSDSLLVWNWIAFCIVISGGFLLFAATSTLYVVNPAFQYKLGLFVPLALIWHIVVQQKVRSWGRERETSSAAKLGALVEIGLWLCVVSAAVEIPSY